MRVMEQARVLLVALCLQFKNKKGRGPMKGIKEFARGEKGVTSIEYALIAVLIALSIIAGATVIGANMQWRYNSVAQGLGG